MKDKMLIWVSKFSTNKYVTAIKNGVIAYAPFTIVASIALLITNFPSEAYINFVTNLLGVSEASVWQNQVNSFMNGTMNLGGIICLLFISYNLAEQYKNPKVKPIYASVITLGVFYFMTPISTLEDGSTAIALSRLGASSLIVAIVLGLIVPTLYKYLIEKKLTIKLPDAVPPEVANSFSSLIPIAIIFVGMFIIKILLEISPFGNIHDFLNVLLSKPLQSLSGSLLGFSFAIFFAMVLWFFGIHGTSIVMGALSPALLMLSDQNRLAFQAGEALPNIITNEFLTYATGTGLYMCIAFLIVGKSRQGKEISKLGLLPAVFGIHEPLVFGYPIMYNIYLGSLYIVLPVIGIILTYFVTSIGLVARLNGTGVPWTAPPGIYAFIGTGGQISAVVWQIILGVIYTILSIPLVKKYDNQLLEQEKLEEGKQLVNNTN
ncbi:PTS sugar transporter subunit IIC [Clostridium sp. HCS.1]|uniref:PTS sugar transporter subunit IIC n=1 Tax=Clostridium sp. HCS.1 TaxID=3238594 RepID=UPI003A101BE5